MNFNIEGSFWWKIGSSLVEFWGVKTKKFPVPNCKNNRETKQISSGILEICTITIINNEFAYLKFSAKVNSTYHVLLIKKIND